MLEQITSKIKTLPPLPNSFHEINAIYNSDDPNINHLAKVIEKDPMLVADLLKTANSPLYNLRREVKSVLQAVTLFGLSMTRALCVSVSAKTLLKIDIEPYGITPEEFGRISNLQGALAYNWYMKINPARKDFLFLCALLQEVGKIFIADEIVINNETTQFKSEISTAFNIEAVERSYASVTSTEISSAVFNHWGFDKDMVDIVKLSQNPFTQEPSHPDAMALYLIRKAIPINSPLSERSINTALTLAEQSDFDTQIFKSAIEHMTSEES